MPVSLDTSVVIDFIQGDEAVTARWRAAVASGEALVISAVALEELAYGAEASGAPERERLDLEVALEMVSVGQVTADDAWLIGAYRARQRLAGRVLSAYDGWIAGHAHVRGWSLATADAKLARAALDLDVQNWREPG